MLHIWAGGMGAAFSGGSPTQDEKALQMAAAASVCDVMYRAHGNPASYLPKSRLETIQNVKYAQGAETKMRWRRCYKARMAIRRALVRMVRHWRTTRASKCTTCGRTPNSSNTAPLKFCGCKCGRLFCNLNCQLHHWQSSGPHRHGTLSATSK